MEQNPQNERVNLTPTALIRGTDGIKPIAAPIAPAANKTDFSVLFSIQCGSEKFLEKDLQFIFYL